MRFWKRAAFLSCAGLPRKGARVDLSFVDSCTPEAKFCCEITSDVDSGCLLLTPYSAELDTRLASSVDVLIVLSPRMRCSFLAAGPYKLSIFLMRRLRRCLTILLRASSCCLRSFSSSADALSNLPYLSNWCTFSRFLLFNSFCGRLLLRLALCSLVLDATAGTSWMMYTGSW